MLFYVVHAHISCKVKWIRQSQCACMSADPSPQEALAVGLAARGAVTTSPSPVAVAPAPTCLLPLPTLSSKGCAANLSQYGNDADTAPDAAVDEGAAAAAAATLHATSSSPAEALAEAAAAQHNGVATGPQLSAAPQTEAGGSCLPAASDSSSEQLQPDSTNTPHLPDAEMLNTLATALVSPDAHPTSEQGPEASNIIDLVTDDEGRASTGSASHCRALAPCGEIINLDSDEDEQCTSPGQAGNSDDDNSQRCDASAAGAGDVVEEDAMEEMLTASVPAAEGDDYLPGRESVPAASL